MRTLIIESPICAVKKKTMEECRMAEGEPVSVAEAARVGQVAKGWRGQSGRMPICSGSRKLTARRGG
jgi:hypothetical protein